MPDRVLREGILRSASFNALQWFEQIVFYRLLNIVDDYGCFDGRTEVIANRIFQTAALRGEEVDEISAALQTLHVAGLLIRYSNKGRGFIAITQWIEGQRLARLYPAPPINVDLSWGVRVKFGKPTSWLWHNPEGWDHVSILLDVHGKAVVPQPPEWRRDDGSPLSDTHLSVKDRTAKYGSARSSVRHATAGAASSMPQATAIQAPVADSTQRRAASIVSEVSKSVVVAEEVVGSKLHNGDDVLIDFVNGEWRGLGEAQRLRWQGMFADVSVPDQIDRAGAWLDAHPGEREAIRSQGAGFQAFLVRWLLREVRGPRSMQG